MELAKYIVQDLRETVLEIHKGVSGTEEDPVTTEHIINFQSKWMTSIIDTVVEN